MASVRAGVRVGALGLGFGFRVRVRVSLGLGYSVITSTEVYMYTTFSGKWVGVRVRDRVC